MIIKMYLISVGVAMLATVMMKIHAMNNPSDPFKAMEKLRKILEEKPELAGFVDFAMDNPQLFFLLLCLCPFINLLVIISCVKGIFFKIDEE